MTREEILALPAGPELDALVAEITGWTPGHGSWWYGPGLPGERAERTPGPPPASTSIAHAWEVVEVMRHVRDLDSYIWAYRDSSMVAFGKADEDGGDRAEDGPIPLLICRAALLATLQ